MSNWKDTLLGIAPTIATALGGPLAGIAISAVGKVLGIDNATTELVADVINNGKLTPEQITEIKKLEMQYQNDEAERGFKYADLAFKDRDSARINNVAGGVQMHLFYMSLVLLIVTLGAELAVLFIGYPNTLPDIVVGRVLGLMDAVAMMVLAYWYGTTNGSAQKTSLLSQADAVK